MPAVAARARSSTASRPCRTRRPYPLARRIRALLATEDHLQTSGIAAAAADAAAAAAVAASSRRRHRRRRCRRSSRCRLRRRHRRRRRRHRRRHCRRRRLRPPPFRGRPRRCRSISSPPLVGHTDAAGASFGLVFVGLSAAVSTIALCFCLHRRVAPHSNPFEQLCAAPSTARCAPATTARRTTSTTSSTTSSRPARRTRTSRRAPSPSPNPDEGQRPVSELRREFDKVSYEKFTLSLRPPSLQSCRPARSVTASTSTSSPEKRHVASRPSKHAVGIVGAMRLAVHRARVVAQHVGERRSPPRRRGRQRSAAPAAGRCRRTARRAAVAPRLRSERAAGCPTRRHPRRRSHLLERRRVGVGHERLHVQDGRAVDEVGAGEHERIVLDAEERHERQADCARPVRCAARKHANWLAAQAWRPHLP